MKTVRLALATALLTAGLSAAGAHAAETCPVPPTAPSAAAAVEGWLDSGAAALTCLQKEFSAKRDNLNDLEKARLVAQMNALSYRIDQARLDALAVSRRASAQTAALSDMDSVSSR